MIEPDFFFDDISKNSALWCASDGADETLARAAETVVTRGMPMVSVAPDSVGRMWTWLEKMPVKIVARFYLNEKTDDKDFSDLAVRINTAFKHGAHGAQIFVQAKNLIRFADAMALVRDDLFFNRDLSVGLDVNEIDAADWQSVFGALGKIRASSIILVMTRDVGDKSDFVGRIHAMLDAWGTFGGDVHFALGGSMVRMEQAWRLIGAMRPGLQSGVRFFVFE